jgi:hypothetical protein
MLERVDTRHRWVDILTALGVPTKFLRNRHGAENHDSGRRFCTVSTRARGVAPDLTELADPSALTVAGELNRRKVKTPNGTRKLTTRKWGKRIGLHRRCGARINSQGSIRRA